MSNSATTALMIVIVAACTWLCRGLPFMLFGGIKKTPDLIKYLGETIPSAIMVILVLYCIRNTEFKTPPYGAIPIISIVIVAILQFWKRNTILSVITGTIIYMLLTRLV